jgi:hypothetical protein
MYQPASHSPLKQSQVRDALKTMHAPLDPVASNGNGASSPRSAKRTRVLMIGTLMGPTGTQKVRVRDISNTGAQMIVTREIPVGSDAVLHRGSLFAAARVAWIKGDEVGLEFYRELSAEEL